MRTLGLTLVVIGITVLSFSVMKMMFSEKDVKIGRVEMNDPEHTEVGWIPILGGIVFIAGTVISVVYWNREKV